jgi:hypothetical protein
MKINNLKQRLSKERPMKTVKLNVPVDVIEDLKHIAPRLGFSGFSTLMRAYIGQGLRADMERLNETPAINEFIESLRRLGVKDELIASAMAEAKGSAEAM